MNKYCYICGREIKPHTLFYCVGPNTHVCDSKECYKTYFWDRLAAKFVVDRTQRYVIVDNNLYEIGDEEDYPRGFGGNYYKIQLENGTIKDTHSLWFIGEIPEDKRYIFKQNAYFMQKGKIDYA